MLTDAADRELELRAHIRSLLSQYALTHLATDHIAWTQAAVQSSLAQCLHPIPTTDRTAVALPPDPYEVLSQRWNLPRLDLYEEKWKVPGAADAIAYLKEAMVSRPQSTIGEQLWKDDHDDAHDAFLLRRPMSPVLSARARRETPNPGQGAFAANLPRTSKHLVRRCKMKGAKPVVFEEPQVNQDDVLANKLPMDADTHRNVLELIAAVPALAKKQTESKPQEVKDFLRCDSPPPDLPELEILPLFPRSQRPYPGPGAEGPSSMPFTSMSKPPQSILSPVAMKDLEEDDLAEEHLVVVNGWQALRTSSPSTPSLADSTSEVDELFMPSSPGSELFCVDKLQMEEHQMPRSERIGGAHGKAPLPGEQHKLGDFLRPLVRAAPPPARGPRIVHSPKSQPSSPRTSITASMLGQPPSNTDVVHTDMRILGDDTNPNSEDSITFAVTAVERACGDRIGNEDPTLFILQEKLDEKDSMANSGWQCSLLRRARRPLFGRKRTSPGA